MRYLFVAIITITSCIALYDKIDTKKELLDVSQTPGEFYIFQIESEASKLTKDNFPLFSIVKIHNKHIGKLEKQGFSKEYFDQVFKKWFFEKYGLKYKDETSIKKVGEEYLLEIDDKKTEHFVIEIVEKKDRVFIVKKPNPLDAGRIQRVKNIMIPLPPFVKYEIKRVADGRISIRPINQRSN